jgi:hypothetical protein
MHTQPLLNVTMETSSPSHEHLQIESAQMVASAGLSFPLIETISGTQRIKET